jgi:3-deoxy-manno-octulosonate cytidylyltransferase (CMP-KDO synthetase)
MGRLLVVESPGARQVVLSKPRDVFPEERVKEKALAVIPARYSSRRFEGKVLAILAGKPVVQHVYERASACGAVGKVIVATDDARVEEAVLRFGGEVAMTSRGHRCGTERVAEVASGLDWDLVLNVQGDEPLISPDALASCVERLAGDETVEVSTLAVPMSSVDDFDRPHVVKLVQDLRGRALYFSRSPLPYGGAAGAGRWLKHIGVYCFRRDYLLSFVKLPPGPLELAEKLEQLRVLEHGGAIGVAVTSKGTVGVDVPEDLARAERALASGETSNV